MSNETKFDYNYFEEIFPDLHLEYVPKSEVVKLPNPAFGQWANRVLEGNSTVYTTPWISSKEPPAIEAEVQELLNDWMRHLEKLETKFPSLVAFEKDLAAKVGPLSVMEPLSGRYDQVADYYKDILRPAEPISEAAVKAVLMEWRNAKGIRMRSRVNTINKMKKSTSSGLPYMQKRRTVLDADKGHGEYQLSVVATYELDKWNNCDGFVEINTSDGLSYSYVGALLGWRGQEGGPTIDDVKQRSVWMFPMDVNIDELRCYQPLIEVAQHFGLVPAWVSMEAVDDAITNLFDTKDPDDLVVCTDFSKFDQHFNSSMQECARTILGELFTKSHEMDYWLEQVFPEKYKIPLCIGETAGRAVFITGKHGMGSGSGGTNADETLAHKALQYEAAQSVDKPLNPYSMCLGDDGILSYPGIKVDDVIRAYTSHGLDMNPDKQYASTQDCVYLRRWHHEAYRRDGKCVGVYSTARALGRLCYQERYMDSTEYPEGLDRAKMITLRELSIIENCKYHPLFEEFIEFCMARDKFRLGIDIPGFLTNIRKFAVKAIAYMPDFLGYTKSMQAKDAASAAMGIADWEVVKYLIKKRLHK